MKFQMKKIKTLSWYDQIILDNMNDEGKLPNKKEIESFEYFYFIKKVKQNDKVKPLPVHSNINKK